MSQDARPAFVILDDAGRFLPAGPIDPDPRHQGGELLDLRRAIVPRPRARKDPRGTGRRNRPSGGSKRYDGPRDPDRRRPPAGALAAAHRREHPPK